MLVQLLFSPNKPFPKWNEVWTLQIQSLKPSSRFSWQGHQEHHAHREKKIQVLTPIELIMTTQLPPRLGAIFSFFAACLALDYSDSGFKCRLTMHSCWIKERFHTCSFLSPMCEFQKDDNYRAALLRYGLLTAPCSYTSVSDIIECDIW